MTRIALAVAVLAAIAVLGLSASAHAAGGTIEINQAVVTAAGGFPYKITAAGSYRLSGNLTPPTSTNAINVTARQRHRRFERILDCRARQFE